MPSLLQHSHRPGCSLAQMLAQKLWNLSFGFLWRRHYDHDHDAVD